MIEVGMKYSDPDGIFEIMGIRRQTVRIKNVQRENLNFGKEYVVDRKEVEYFVKHPFSPF